MTADAVKDRVKEALHRALRGRDAAIHVSQGPDGGWIAVVDARDPALATHEARKGLQAAADGAAGAPVQLAVSAPKGSRPAPSATPDGGGPKPGRTPHQVDFSNAPYEAIDVLAVASGKGGVGKSTVAANLAVAAARMGRKVGFLDADIYGPSAPTLFGLRDAPPLTEDKRPIAPRAYDVAVMSIGMLVRPDKALAWRGPMATGALSQLWRDTEWGGVDLLVVDMPPGTGDVHLTFAQKMKIDGAVVVTTPNEIALADARRAVSFFGATKIPVLGLVENMSVVEDPETGARVDLFGEGGGKAEARSLKIPFLGAAPMTPSIRRGVDTGRPIAADPNAPETAIFDQIARDALAALTATKKKRR